MSDDNKTNDLTEKNTAEDGVCHWRAVSREENSDASPVAEYSETPASESRTESVLADVSNEASEKEDGSVVYSNAVLSGRNFSGADLTGADFSGADLTGADFSGAILKDVNFAGADLTGADFSGADLTGADFSGAILKDVNFAGANLEGVKLSGADIEGAVFREIRIDELGTGELQALIEYLAKYYPHKLNLSKINLQLLDLTRIDLTQLDLRGADFTGVDFTGVNITGLDLSSCIITPAQIAQALGRTPSQSELAKILPPRKKNGKGQDWTIDWQDFFLNDREIGVWDTTKDSGFDIDKMVKTGRKVFSKEAAKPRLKEGKGKIRSEREAREKEHNEKMREIIEKNKQAVLEARKEQKKEFEEQRQSEDQGKYELDISLMHSRGSHER